jgi:membrane-associated phospholipid phosphatase
VREVGRVNSSSRPSDRTDVANVYFVLTVVNLYSPIARHLSSVQGKTLSENARIFALLAMAGADALISSMESKFHYNFWRPVTAIRAGDLDGNAKTYSDPTWASLIATPPYPGYPSNHASLAGASLAVLQDVFGNSGHNITLSAVGGVVLKYNVLATIADDIDDARVFGGIHFRFDQEAGSKLGREVGHHILQHELRARQPNQSRP